MQFRQTSFITELKNLNSNFDILQNINCYLIDNNGFILVSEDYTQVSEHLLSPL